MARYGIVRNGEHGKLVDTREKAEAQVIADKALDEECEREGWIKDASKTHYRIVEVKRLPW